jgi:protein-L-isoaspartate(D-aspartate) O-methyltransferase
MGMLDHQKLREAMVEAQLVPRGIRDRAVLNAMRIVPRHHFVDAAAQHMAYDDMALPIGEGQTISQPYMVAVMTELLALSGTERVLEIGTGSGYQAAVLSHLAKEVFTVERISSLAEKAIQRLHDLSCSNVYVRIGDGTLGWPEKAPFDRIIITAASPKIPAPLKEQVSENGIIVIPVGSRYSQQLLRITKKKSGFEEEYHTPCVFVPLIGEHGWKERE